MWLMGEMWLPVDLLIFSDWLFLDVFFACVGLSSMFDF